MERLTQRLRTGEVLMASEYEEKYTEQEWISVLQVRLAAYEETERTPEEIDMDHEAAEQLRQLCRNCDLDRLVNLAEADKDGRLVVLPCKVGDTVYFAAWFGTEPHIIKRIIEPYFYTDDARGGGSTADFFLRDFGKTVFLTREEAEKALETMKNGT